MQREQLLHPSSIIKLVSFVRILLLKMFRIFADATPCNSQAVSDTPTPPEQKKTKKKRCGRNVFESSCQSFSGCHLHFKQTVKASWSLVLDMQPCDKADMLLVNWIQFFLEELTWKWKCFSSRPPSWPPWRHMKTSNTTIVDGYLWQIPSWTP